jgi:uncharacterized membrane protein YtjA (UPF0391 family)
MLRLALLMFVLAIVALGLGFGGIAGLTMNIAWYLFFGFIVLTVVFAIVGRSSGPPTYPAY